MIDLVLLRAALTAVALSYPTATLPGSPEAPEARVARLGVVSEATVEAAARATCAGPWATVDARSDGSCRRLWPGDTVELAAVLWSLAYLESALADWVHAGRCRVNLGECDVGRARSLWQLQLTGYSREAWRELEGMGEWSTFQSAWTAARVASAGRAMCTRWRPGIPWAHATVSAYATGGACSWPRAGKRVAFIVRVEAKLRDELRKRAPDH